MTPLPRVRPLSFLIAAACAGLPLCAHADPTITLTAAYSLTSTTPTVNGLTDPDASLGPAVSFPTPDGSDFYLNKNGASGNNVFFHAYGFTGASNPTYFGARASGMGDVFAATTSSLYNATFTNTSTAAVALSFSFNVDGGEVGLFGSGTGVADLLLRVRRDGAVVSQGHTTITQGLTGTTCAEDDVGALGGWASCAAGDSNSVFGSGGMFTVDMGLVGAGASVTIDYDIVATVSGQYTDGAQSAGDCYGGYAALTAMQGQDAVEHPSSQCVYFNGIARSGDPFNGGQPFATADFTIGTNNPTPEPGSLALLSLATGGLWWQRRRRAGKPL